MIEYICSFEEEYGFLVSESMKCGEELIRCKDCKYWKMEHYVGGEGMACQIMPSDGNVNLTEPTDFCSWAERKDEYVTLHHEDIHFIDEDAERAFYESLEEMKNTRSFTAEEWEFYKKVNREKTHKTGLNIRDFMGAERKE